MIDYDADLEDRLWYNIFPFVAYGAVAAGSFLALALSAPRPEGDCACQG